MGEMILTNAAGCDAWNAITRRLRRELLDAAFYQREFHTLQFIITAHVRPDETIRVDVEQRRRRKNNAVYGINTDNKQYTFRSGQVRRCNYRPHVHARQGVYFNTRRATLHSNRLRSA